MGVRQTSSTQTSPSQQGGPPLMHAPSRLLQKPMHPASGTHTLVLYVDHWPVLFSTERVVARQDRPRGQPPSSLQLGAQ